MNKDLTATLTCPKCGHKQKAEMPTTCCVAMYQCQGCKQTITSKKGCIFCLYADKKCPVPEYCQK